MQNRDDMAALYNYCVGGNIFVIALRRLVVSTPNKGYIFPPKAVMLSPKVIYVVEMVPSFSRFVKFSITYTEIINVKMKTSEFQPMI